MRDLLVYAEAIEGHICYYRDNTNLEVDAIIESYDGKWAAIEIKAANKSSSKIIMCKRAILNHQVLYTVLE